MENIVIGSDHSVTENDAKEGKKEDGPVLAAKDVKTQEKESAHEHTTCQHEVIRFVPVFLQKKHVFVADKKVLVRPCAVMPEIGDLQDEHQGIGFSGWNGEIFGGPKGGGCCFCGSR